MNSETLTGKDSFMSFIPAFSSVIGISSAWPSVEMRGLWEYISGAGLILPQCSEKLNAVCKYK
ncbi:hypothetical protein J2W17_003822 [Pseudomonas lini]|jgi:hypothetical protein|nr:hypothetical protein [Pseudomonas lini]